MKFKNQTNCKNYFFRSIAVIATFTRHNFSFDVALESAEVFFRQLIVEINRINRIIDYYSAERYHTKNCDLPDIA